MTKAVDKATLLKRRLSRTEFEVEGVGTVTLRGLSRAEVIELSSGDRPDVGVFERQLVALAMVDPELTEDEVQEWREAADAGEFESVVQKISDLSGLGDGVDKASF